MIEKLSTITCEEIMTTPLEPIAFCIENLMAQGLYVFAGAPKIGKSWLSLDICLSIAKGENVLGQPTAQGTALYLCLEDNQIRLQNRLYELTDEPTENLHFSLLAKSIGGGLEEQIRLFRQEHPDLKIVVIDTLQKIRSDEEPSYTSDYKELTVLKSLADELCITILLVHHTRKCHDSDPFNMISGSTGLRGCADGAFVLLCKDKHSHEATLHCEGRDIESRELKLRFDSAVHRWQVLADSIMQPERFDDEIITAMVTVMQAEESFCGTPTELTAKINQHTHRQYVPNVVSKKILQSAGRLMQHGILFEMKRSNGTRKIHAEYIRDESADSDDRMMSLSSSAVDPVKNVETTLF